MLRSSPGSNLLSIGAVATRTGLAVSAVRFYADEGFVPVHRSGAGHRKFDKSVIRRLSFIRICQSLGYSLEEIRARLEQLPQARAPTREDWEQMAAEFRGDLDRRIEGLTQLRDKLSACIGCGCLSLDRCEIYNPKDKAGKHGVGARYLLVGKGDE